MNKEDTKQAIFGFTEFFKGITGNQDLKIPDDIAKEYEIETDSEEVKKAVTTQEAYKLGKLDALNEIKEEIKNCIVHSPYFHTTKDCCRVRDDVMQIFDKHITKIEEVINEHKEDQAYSFPEVFGEPIEMLIDDVWIKGKVINGYRSRDGIVNMETSDGKKYWCGCERKDCYRQPKENKE